jgi:hypothetical protein
MPKHDEELGGISGKNIGGQLGSVHVHLMQWPLKSMSIHL